MATICRSSTTAYDHSRRQKGQEAATLLQEVPHTAGLACPLPQPATARNPSQVFLSLQEANNRSTCGRPRNGGS